MKLVAGIDIGNATTETALARIEDGHAVFLASGTVPTTGIKGTRQNINGIFHSLTNALEKAGLEFKELSEVRLNDTGHSRQQKVLSRLQRMAIRPTMTQHGMLP